MNINLAQAGPSPGTALVRLFARGHRVQARISFETAPINSIYMLIARNLFRDNVV
jgi:hypothetical protein